VDVDECQDTAAAQGVSAMPTFIFFRQGQQLSIAHYQPAFPATLTYFRFFFVSVLLPDGSEKF
jgi:thioredoxin-like negative regulator of GroEL